MAHNFVNRIFSEYQEGNNVDPVGYRFEILYSGNLVLTDGLLYPTFDECVECMSKSLMSLHAHKCLQPIVVSFADL